MAGVLRFCGAWNVDSVVTILLVATGQLGNQVFEAIQDATKNRGYRIIVHKCELISDVVYSRPDLHVDFIVFAFDARVSHLVSKVEQNISHIDEFFIISGRVCLVNCYGSQSTMNLMTHSANKLKEKYCMRLLSANVYKTEGQHQLGSRILNLVEALIGIRSGIPDLNMLSLL